MAARLEEGEALPWHSAGLQVWVRGRRQYAVKGDVTGEKERFLAMVGAVTSEMSSVRTGAFQINASAPLGRGARGGAGGRG